MASEGGSVVSKEMGKDLVTYGVERCRLRGAARKTTLGTVPQSQWDNRGLILRNGAG